MILVYAGVSCLYCNSIKIVNDSYGTELVIHIQHTQLHVKHMLNLIGTTSDFFSRASNLCTIMVPSCDGTIIVMIHGEKLMLCGTIKV